MPKLCGTQYGVGKVSIWNELYKKELQHWIHSSILLNSLVYKNRAACFMQMEMYTKAMMDIRCALKFQHTARALLQLQIQRKECEKKLTIESIDAYVPPKLSYPVDRDFPCMANVLEIRDSKKFGRHIVAKQDIEVGKVVMVSEIFASAAVSDTLTTCRICNKTERDFVACTDCSNVMYCRGSCANQINIHRLECGTIFHVIDANLKLPVQTLLMAINIFTTIDELMRFVERYVGKNNGHEIPKAANNFETKYGLFLTLTRRNCSELIYLAYQVYTTLLTFPKVKRLVNNGTKMLFLAHLTLHHVTVIARNSFQYQAQDIGTIKTSYIYDVMSLINHSCSPNLFNISRPDDVSHCITVKPILAGEQVFINYLGNSASMTLNERQKNLASWNFKCECERCVYEMKQESNPIKSVIEADPAFQYVKRTCQEKECRLINWESGKRSTLKSHCIEFLGKYGHLNWTPEIQTVVHCFTLH